MHINVILLFFVSTRCSSATSSFEFTSFRSNVWSCVWVWHTGSLSEVSTGFASCTFALNENGIFTGWGNQGQLIECHNFATELCDAFTSWIGDTECANSQFWNFQQSQVICHGSNNYSDCVLGSSALLHQSAETLQWHNWTIHSAHKHTSQNDFVELLVSTAVHVPVQLKKRRKFHSY